VLSADSLLCVACAASPKPSSKRPVDEPPPEEDLGDVAEDLGVTNGNKNTGSSRPPTKKVDPETPPLVVPTIKAPRVPKCGKSAGAQNSWQRSYHFS
jgi:hypothetical protein